MCSQHGHSKVQEVIFDGLATVRTAGILATDPALAVPRRGRAVHGGGGGTTLLVKAASGLVERFGAGASKALAAPSGGY